MPRCTLAGVRTAPAMPPVSLGPTWQRSGWVLLLDGFMAGGGGFIYRVGEMYAEFWLIECSAVVQCRNDYNKYEE